MIRIYRRNVALGAFLILTLALFAPRAGAQVLTADADAHVTANVNVRIPNHYNFGAMTYLLVQNDPARTYKTYLRFNLAPIIAAGGVGVRNATLIVTFSRFREPGSGDVKDGNTITVYGITDNVDTWSEGTEKGANHPTDITFNNAPHNDKSSSTGLLDAADKDGAAVRQVATFTVPRDAPTNTDVRVDVAPFINWALNGGAYGTAPAGDADKVVTFVLVHSGGNADVANNGVQFFSKENTAGPGGENLPALAPRLAYVVETTPPSVKGTVITIVDAETLVVRGVGNVRLAGVSALRNPKRKPLPDDDLFGEEADRALRRMAAGHTVRLEFDGAGKDAKGAALAWVFLDDGTLLNEQMVWKGYAKVGPMSKDARYGARLRAAEEDAKANKRNLWPFQK